MKNRAGTELSSLKKNNDILFVLRKGRRLHTKTLSLWYLSARSRKIEYGLIVNKNIFKLAIVRNKIKRQLRMMLHQLPCSGDVKLLIKPNALYLQNSYEHNMIELQSMLKIIGNKNGK